MPIPWEIIIPAVIQLISQCMNDGAEEADIRAALKNPTPLQKAIIEAKVLRAIPLRQRLGNRQQILDEFWSRQETATDMEINYLMSQA